MSRISISEKVEYREIDLNTEITKLRTLFNGLLRTDARILFPYIEKKMGCFDKEEYLRHLSSNIGSENNIETYLDLCDIFFIFYKTAKRVYKDMKNLGTGHLVAPYITVYESVLFILDKLNYQIIVNDKNEYIIAIKDAVAEKVASIPDYEDIKWRILDYNAYKTSLQDKKDILSALYTTFEKIRPDLRETNRIIEKSLGELINLIRHTDSKQNKKTYPFYYENEEAWCDKTYDLLLEALLHEENKKIADELEINKKQL